MSLKFPYPGEVPPAFIRYLEGKGVKVASSSETKLLFDMIIVPDGLQIPFQVGTVLSPKSHLFLALKGENGLMAVHDPEGGDYASFGDLRQKLRTDGETFDRGLLFDYDSFQEMV